MNIYEISEKAGVGIRSLKKLDKMGFLIVHKSKNPIVDKIRHNLRRGNRLTAVQQLHLFKNPKDCKFLAQWEYEIEECMADLGDVMRESMPWHISGWITLAASKDKQASHELATWLRRFIDRNPAFANGAQKQHAFLAVRMLADVPDNHFEAIASLVQRAMWNCRNNAALRGYWHVDATSRRTFYHRPLDL